MTALWSGNWQNFPTNIHDFLQMLMIPSANDLRVPHRVDFFESSDSLACERDVSLNDKRINK